MPTQTDLPPASIPEPFVPNWAGLAVLAPAQLRAAAAAVVAAPLPPVNTTLVSPAGFDAFDDDGPGAPMRPLAELRTMPSGTMRVYDGRSRLFALDPPAVLSAAQLAALRPYAGVRVPFGAGSGPVELAGLLRQLLVGGAPVLAPDLPLVVRRLLGRMLGELVATLTPSTLADPDRRERWSVAARRAALRTATAAAGVTSSPPSVTAVVPGDAALARDLGRQTWPALTVRVAADAAARRRALETCETDLVTFPAAGLDYAPEHVEDLVLGRGYGQRPVSGVLVRRTFLPALDVTVRAGGAGGGERFADTLTAATVLGSAADLLELGLDRVDGPAAVVSVGGDGYAIHDLGVRRLVRDAGGVEEVLRAGGRQWGGSGRVDPGYASYFARTA